jgi:hypothetical protein
MDASPYGVFLGYHSRRIREYHHRGNWESLWRQGRGALSARILQWRSVDTSLINHLSTLVPNFRRLAIVLRSDNLANHLSGRMGAWFR